jgi:hypothetical protein
MADALSDYLEEALMKAIFHATPFSPPPSVFVGLFTTTPTDSNNGVEASGTNYTRIEVNCTSGWNPPVAMVGGFRCDNAAIIEFPVAGGNWGTINGVGIYDAATNGNLLFYGNLTTPQTCVTGSQIKFAIGDLDITLGH